MIVCESISWHSPLSTFADDIEPDFLRLVLLLLLPAVAVRAATVTKISAEFSTAFSQVRWQPLGMGAIRMGSWATALASPAAMLRIDYIQ